MSEMSETTLRALRNILGKQLYQEIKQDPVLELKKVYKSWHNVSMSQTEFRTKVRELIQDMEIFRSKHNQLIKEMNKNKEIANQLFKERLIKESV